jgi:hypothetical protein
MDDIPKVPEKSWHTELTGEIQPVRDRESKKKQAGTGSRGRGRGDETDADEADADSKREHKEKPAKPDGDQQQGSEPTTEKRCDSEPGQVIDFEA